MPNSRTIARISLFKAGYGGNVEIISVGQPLARRTFDAMWMEIHGWHLAVLGPRLRAPPLSAPLPRRRNVMESLNAVKG